MLFGLYLGGMESFYHPKLTTEILDRTNSGNKNRAIQAVHDLYINHLGIRPNTQETQWVQKPAGIPSFLNLAKFEIHESDIIDFPY